MARRLQIVSGRDSTDNAKKGQKNIKSEKVERGHFLPNLTFEGDQKI